MLTVVASFWSLLAGKMSSEWWLCTSVSVEEAKRDRERGYLSPAVFSLPFSLSPLLFSSIADTVRREKNL